MRTYEEIINTIENSRRFENRPGVEIAKIMLDKLGNPEKKMTYVHVAGTNGKGSTCAFLNSIFSKAGLRAGVFTSPHLIDFEERIAIGDRLIAKEDVTRLGNMLLDIDFGVTPTMFDYCLVMAVLYFREQKCDITIMETGLGGRLDSTNALGTPVASVITKIGFDHMAFLGNTLTEIATEKAGIIKKESYVVVESQEKEAALVFEKYLSSMPNHRIINANDIEYISKLGISMAGVFQWENGAAAKAAAEYVLINSFGMKDMAKLKETIDEGLRTAHWAGRMEIISREPFVMVDGAHNGNGVRALRDSLVNMFPEEKFHFFMGVMADKDYPAMVEELLPLAIDFVTVTPESSRALQAEELAEFIREKGVQATGVSSAEEIIAMYSSEEKNIVFGSLYFIGELKWISIEK